MRVAGPPVKLVVLMASFTMASPTFASPTMRMSLTSLLVLLASPTSLSLTCLSSPRAANSRSLHHTLIKYFHWKEITQIITILHNLI